jgi:hypothetical protein
VVLRDKDVYVPETVRQLILEKLKQNRFGTVREVVASLKTAGVSDQVALNVIKEMAREGEVLLNLPGAPEDTVMTPVKGVSQYFFSTLAFDWWLTLLLLVLGISTTFLIPEAFFPWVIFRWIFSSLLLVFVPGFAFVRLLFPFDRFIDRWERLVLSCGLSIALSVLVAFGLNFTSWGITPAPITTGIALITLASILLATYRRARILIQ